MTDTLTPTMERDSLVARPDADELYSIIIDLFAPDRHFDGCLFKANGNMPCQCGYQERMVRYKVAVEKAKAIASKHDYMCWEASYAD